MSLFYQKRMLLYNLLVDVGCDKIGESPTVVPFSFSGSSPERGEAYSPGYLFIVLKKTVPLRNKRMNYEGTKMSMHRRFLSTYALLCSLTTLLLRLVPFWGSLEVFVSTNHCNGDNQSPHLFQGEKGGLH